MVERFEEYLLLCVTFVCNIFVEQIGKSSEDHPPIYQNAHSSYQGPFGGILKFLNDDEASCI